MRYVENILPGFLLLLIATSALALKDPTRPHDFQKEVSASFVEHPFVLSAIITNHSRRIALINGHLVKEGDTLEGGRVVSIETSMVQLETPGGRINLFLPGGSVRTPAAAAIARDIQGNRE